MTHHAPELRQVCTTGTGQVIDLADRARRTHGLKHYGWTDVPTATGTQWTSPAGQLIVVDRYTPAPPRLDPEAELPDPTGSTSSKPSCCADPRPASR